MTTADLLCTEAGGVRRGGKKKEGLQAWENRISRERLVLTKLTSFHHVLSYKGKGGYGISCIIS